MHKAHELLDELRTVVGRGGLLDTILPPLLFVLFNGWWGIAAAMWAALGLALIFTIFRLARREPFLYALSGLGSVALAIALAFWLGRSEGFFLPGIVNNAFVACLALISLLIRRPMVAWTSFLARRWPLDWYWHPQVRPAYSEVTWAWLLFFILRLAWQVILFQQSDVSRLALVNWLTGWPATLLLLICSYIYGTWRLTTLHGPSVEEFRNRSAPPWQGQQRGF